MMKGKAVIAALSLMMAASLQAEEGLVTYKALSPNLALKLAQATMASCQKAGYQVAVAVTDRFGNVQVLLRDRYAGAHTLDIAPRKAWTAASFNTDTAEMVDVTGPGEAQSGVRFASQAMMVAGGVRIQAGGSLVGAIGVSGAPGGAEDHKCALEGIAAIEEDLAFL